MTPTSLGSSSLKRQLESVPEEPDESPLAKRSRAAQDEHVENDWDVAIAKIRALGKPSNEPSQSAPKAEVSKSSAPSQSPPPPPAPWDPPPVSRITHDLGLEERFRALEASFEDKFSQLMDRLDTRPPPEPAAPCDPPTVSTPYYDRGLEERFRVLEASLEDKFSELIRRLDALETRPPPPPAQEGTQGDPFGDPLVLARWSWIANR